MCVCVSIHSLSCAVINASSEAGDVAGQCVVDKPYLVVKVTSGTEETSNR